MKQSPQQVKLQEALTLAGSTITGLWDFIGITHDHEHNEYAVVHDVLIHLIDIEQFKKQMKGQSIIL